MARCTRRTGTSVLPPYPTVFFSARNQHARLLPLQTSLLLQKQNSTCGCSFRSCCFCRQFIFAVVSQHVYVEDGFWDTTWEVLAYLILMIAAIGRVWTSAYISGRKTHEIVCDGPYSLTRNPLYFFSLLAYLGAGLAFEKLTVALAFVAVFWLTHWPTIMAEEAKLRNKLRRRVR